MAKLEMQKGKKRVESTQKYLNIAEIKEDTIVLRDGGLRAVIVVSSTNFALKSEEEQNGLVAGYQNFLNSLDFPIQILIHSRILDINGYLEKMRDQMAGQTNELLRIQMSEYIEYIAKLVEYANIMSKTFYVVVPYSAEAAKQTFLGKVTKLFNPAAEIATKSGDFQRMRGEVDKRVENLVSELGGMGLRSLRLKTPELIELLYQSYNFESGSPVHAEAMEEIDITQN